MEYQIRRYRIAEDHMADFVAAWQAGVVPLRRQLGFVIEGAWVMESTNEFVWILGYKGPDGFDAADEAYYASTERRDLDPDPARWIEEATETTATPAVKP